MTPPEFRLVVVNASKFPSDFIDYRMYCCPATEGGFHDSYVHMPAKYIGNYVSQGVKYVGVVAAAVRLNKTGPAEVLWKFDDISDEDAIARAEEVRIASRRNSKPCMVILQSDLSVTDFVYDLRGGLMMSRLVFDVKELEPTGIKDLAIKLRTASWSGLPKLKPEVAAPA